MIGKTVKLLGPHRVVMGGGEIEQPRVEDGSGIDTRKISLDQPRIGVQRVNDLARGIRPRGPGITHLVQHDDIGEFDLVGQQMHQRAGIPLARDFAPIGQDIVAGIVAQQVHRIDHSDHRVEPRHIGQAVARRVAEFEGRRHRQGFRHARRFDQQIVEAPRLGQTPHLLQKIIAKGAADATVRHLDQRFLGLGQARACAHQIRGDVDLGHVVDDHGHATPVAIVQNGVEERRLARAQKAGQDGDGQA